MKWFTKKLNPEFSYLVEWRRHWNTSRVVAPSVKPVNKNHPRQWAATVFTLRGCTFNDCVCLCVCVCLPSAKRGLVAEKAHNFLSSIYPDIHRSIHTTTCPPHTSLHPAEPWESVWRPPPHTRTSRPHIHLFSSHSFVIFPSPSPLCMCVCVCVCAYIHMCERRW